MKKIFIYISGLLLLISCNNNKKEVVEYYDNENPKSVYIYKKSIKQDSSIHFYETPKAAVRTIKYWKDGNAYYQKDFFENGNLRREGRLLRDNFRIGKWDLYNSEGYKLEVIEYFNINNKSYINQVWKLNSKGDTIPGGGFYEVKNKDTISYNTPIRFYFFLRQRILLDSDLSLCFAKKGYFIKPDFSNQYKVLLDTVKNMSIEFKNHPKFKNREYDVLFDLMPRKMGHDTLRGFLLEKKIVKNNDTVDFITRQFYFNIPYYVKE